MKVTISVELDKILKTPVTDWTAEDEGVLDQGQASLPRKKNEVVLPKDETMMEPGQNAKPLTHIVKAGETLKSIAEKYSVSYGELSNHLMNTEGTTSIYEGQKIEIPRHFIDLSGA